MFRPAARWSLLLALVLPATGCGGAKSPSVAQLGAITTTAPAVGTNAPAPSSRAQLQHDAVAYAKCMRSSGVPDFPDPAASGGFVFQPGSGVDPASPAFKAAQTTCRKLMPGPTPGSATHPSAQWLAHMVAVAKCMRRHGIADFPDPRTSIPADPFPGGAGLISDIEGAVLVFPSTIDTQSPLFTRAAAACGFPLHNH